MKIGEFFLSLGFDVEEGKLKEFTDNVKGLNATMIKSAGIAAGAIYGLQAFVENTVTGARALNNFREQTGLAWDELQKWQVAGRLSEVALSADEVQSSISNLQKSIAEISMGRGDASAFAMLGIDVMGKDAFDILDDLRAVIDANISRYGKTQTVNLIERMGLDPRFITLLKMSRSEMENLRKEFTMTDRAQKQLLELGGVIERFKLKLEFLKMEGIAEFAPQLIGFFKNIAAAAEGTFKGLSTVARWFLKITEAVPGLSAGLTLIAAGLTMMFVPFGNVVAGAMLLLAAFNDLGAYLRGEDSWIGWLIEKVEYLVDLLGTLGTKIGKAIRSPITAMEETGTRWGEKLRDSDILRFLRMPSAASAGNDRAVPPQINNTYYIEGNAAPDAVAKEITRQQQQQLNYGLTDANNGSLY